ncbi:MAG: hypothetical protein U9R05_09360 [Chloroflexota bacterium]|nr:hypothetical protein [Chloroflexota bacterium]
MAFKPLQLTVLTPVETLLEVTGVSCVQLRLADGAGLSIYPGHAPLLAETVAGPLRYTTASGEHASALEAGILHITLDGVTLFTPGALLSGTGEPGDAGQMARFDRLAGVLFAALQAESEGRDVET